MTTFTVAQERERRKVGLGRPLIPPEGEFRFVSLHSCGPEDVPLAHKPRTTGFAPVSKRRLANHWSA